MNIYELEKQATPGPFHTIDRNCLGLLDARDRRVASVHVLNGATQITDNPQATAALFVHCCNNFMQALIALKDAERWIATLDRESSEQAIKMRGLIDELEKVK